VEAQIAEIKETLVTMPNCSVILISRNANAAAGFL